MNPPSKKSLWNTFLLALVFLGLIAYSFQLAKGLTITGMGRVVAWGLYISNFTFLVGVAASAVILVLPFYVYKVKEFKTLALVGESVAISSVAMCILFVLVDLGRIDRISYIFLYPNLTSVMFFDLVVLSGYLIINILILGFYLYKIEYVNLLKILVYLSIPWAISIHTVTAFIYSGLIAREFWNSAIIAPRFLASAFASGAAIILMTSYILKKTAIIDIPKRGLDRLSEIAAFAMISNLFLIGVEFFTALYTNNPDEIQHYYYILFGFSESSLYSYLWLFSVSLGIVSTLLFIHPVRRKEKVLLWASFLMALSIWAEKGLLLIVPAYVPSALGVIEEYVPTIAEIFISTGIWAFGLLLLTALLQKVLRSEFQKISAGI
jgi:molybdopterin-containing oxidoreductase family membrane subunit